LMITDKMLHRELSESIVGATMKVLNTLKPGLSEKAYENALVVELMKRGHTVQQQRRFEVRYEGILVDSLVCRTLSWKMPSSPTPRSFPNSTIPILRR